MFGLPGLGKVAVEALTGFDLLVVMGIGLATLAIIVFANLAVDLLRDRPENRLTWRPTKRLCSRSMISRRTSAPMTASSRPSTGSRSRSRRSDARHRRRVRSGKSVTCLTIMGLNARNTITSGTAAFRGEDLLEDE